MAIIIWIVLGGIIVGGSYFMIRSSKINKKSGDSNVPDDRYPLW